MAVTTTTRAGLSKQAAGDEAWHTALNATLDRLDIILARLIPEGAESLHDPNVISLPGFFIGQRVFDPVCIAWWVCTAAGTPGTWKREMPQGMIMEWSGNVAAVPAGWAICDGTLVVLPTEHGGNLATPDLGGLYSVGYDAGDIEYSENMYGVGGGIGQKKFTVLEANIQQFSKQSSGPSGGVLPKQRTTTNLTFGGGGADIPSPSLDNHTHTTIIGSATPTQIDNRPPSYVVAKVIKI